MGRAPRPRRHAAATELSSWGPCALPDPRGPTPPRPAAGAMGIDESTWAKLEAGVKGIGDDAIQPLGGDECRKRCGLEA